MSRGQGYLAKGHSPEVEEGYDYRVGGQALDQM
jgi:hypothetical protein